MAGLMLEPPAVLKEQGNCSVKEHKVNFYPKAGGSYQEPMRMCSDCPVWRECAEWAIEQSEYGCWGGTTEEDRKLARRHRPTGAKGPWPWPKGLEHGSGNESFKAHLRAGELPCDECFTAWVGNYPRFIINRKGS